MATELIFNPLLEDCLQEIYQAETAPPLAPHTHSFIVAETKTIAKGINFDFGSLGTVQSGNAIINYVLQFKGNSDYLGRLIFKFQNHDGYNLNFKLFICSGIRNPMSKLYNTFDSSGFSVDYASLQANNSVIAEKDFVITPFFNDFFEIPVQTAITANSDYYLFFTGTDVNSLFVSYYDSAQKHPDITTKNKVRMEIGVGHKDYTGITQYYMAVYTDKLPDIWFGTRISTGTGSGTGSKVECLENGNVEITGQPVFVNNALKNVEVFGSDQNGKLIAKTISIPAIVNATQTEIEEAVVNPEINTIPENKQINIKGLRWFLEKIRNIAHTFTESITFNKTPVFSSLKSKEVLGTDANGNLVEKQTIVSSLSVGDFSGVYSGLATETNWQNNLCTGITGTLGDRRAGIGTQGCLYIAEFTQSGWLRIYVNPLITNISLIQELQTSSNWTNEKFTATSGDYGQIFIDINFIYQCIDGINHTWYRDLIVSKTVTLNNSFTGEGGICVYLQNKTGANTRKGTIVSASATNGGFVMQQSEYDFLGIVYDEGILPDGMCRIVIGGIAEVLMRVGTDAIAGKWAIPSDVSGSVICADVPNPADVGYTSANHNLITFKRIGCFTESKTGGISVLSKIVIYK